MTWSYWPPLTEPIIPSVGLAGIELGFHEHEVITRLSIPVCSLGNASYVYYGIVINFEYDKKVKEKYSCPVKS